MVDAWAKCTDEIADEMMKEISSVKKDEKTGREAQVNSIYMMAHSGARGSPAQMKQLAGMRGLMAKPSGEIIETPIISNFKEGLSVLEYFNSTHGARKGLADTALKTANSGYLTRRLVDVAQDCIITRGRLRHQGRHHGARHRRRGHGGGLARQRILGRTTAEDIKDPATGKVIVAKRGTLLDEPEVEAIEAAGVQEVKIRSVLTCETDERRLRHVLRARPRPRHAGQHGRGGRRHRGAVDRRAGHAAHHAHVPHRRHGAGGRAVVPRVELRRHGQDPQRATSCTNSDGELIAMGRNMRSSSSMTTATSAPTHRIPYGARLLVDDGDTVKRGQRLAEWDPYTRPILTEVDGTVALRGPGRRPVGAGDADESTGITKRVVIDWRARPARRRPASGDRDQGQGRQDR